MRPRKMYSAPVVAALLLFMMRTPAESQAEQDNDLPVATQLLFESLGATGSQGPRSVFKIICGNGKGTGFALDTGYLITNAHVVDGCKAGDLSVISAAGKLAPVVDLLVDDDRDLAAARLTKFTGGLKIDTAAKRVETKVLTWGHPLSYDGPPPLLTVGYLSGFIFEPPPSTPRKSKTKPIRQLVLNAAINPGNSGGPLLYDQAVIGVVVSKGLFPLPPAFASALRRMSQVDFGVTYEGTDQSGKKASVSESQLVAAMLEHYRNMTQVVIGHAIRAQELVAFLDEHKIPWTPKTENQPKAAPVKPRAH